ncbi:hypothetical protein LTR16_010060, partial [Cryomyces antarcticus]
QSARHPRRSAEWRALGSRLCRLVQRPARVCLARPGPRRGRRRRHHRPGQRRARRRAHPAGRPRRAAQDGHHGDGARGAEQEPRQARAGGRSARAPAGRFHHQGGARADEPALRRLRAHRPGALPRRRGDTAPAAEAHHAGAAEGLFDAVVGGAQVLGSALPALALRLPCLLPLLHAALLRRLHTHCLCPRLVALRPLRLRHR